jgi:hypothetical protein
LAGLRLAPNQGLDKGIVYGFKNSLQLVVLNLGQTPSVVQFWGIFGHFLGCKPCTWFG